MALGFDKIRNLAVLATCATLALVRASAAEEPRVTAGDAVRVVGEERYVWRNAVMGGVEYATGLVWSPRNPQVVLLRADGGGVWRLERGKPGDANPHETYRWTSLTDNVPWQWGDFLTADSVAIDPDDPRIIYLAGGGGRWSDVGDVLKTTDAGRTWQRTNLRNREGKNIVGDGNGADKQGGERLVVDPNDGRVLFYATRNDGLYTSTDRAQTWTPVESFPVRGAKWTGLTFVEFDWRRGKPGEPTQSIYVGVHAGKGDGDATVDDGVYASHDGGKSWQHLTGDGAGAPPPAASPLRARVAVDGGLYVTFVGSIGGNKPGGGGGVWRFADGRWTDLTPKGAEGRPFCGINLHPSDPDQIVVAGTHKFGGNVFHSTDAGQTWRHYRFEKGNKPSGSIRLAFYPPWEMDGDDWDWGGNASDVAFDPLDPQTLYYTSFSGPALLRGVGGDRLTGWLIGDGREQMTCADVVSPTAGAPLVSGVWDVGGFRHAQLDQIPHARIARREADGSLHKEGYRHGYQDVFDLDAQPGHPDRLVLAGGWQWNSTGEAAFSTDNGTTFRPFPTMPFDGAKFGRVALGVESDNVVWAPMGSRDTPVYFTTDNGRSWRASDGAPRGMIATEGVWSFYRCLAADRVRAGRFYMFDRRDGGFYRSDDGGATFARASTLPKQQCVHFDWHRVEAAPYRADDVWVAMQGHGLFRSTDGGSTWRRLEGVQWAQNIAFGKGRDARDVPAVYLFGHIGGDAPARRLDVRAALYRSDDLGHTWVRVNGDDIGFGQAPPAWSATCSRSAAST